MHLNSHSVPQGSVIGSGWGIRSHLWSDTVSWSDSLVHTGFLFLSPTQEKRNKRCLRHRIAIKSVVPLPPLIAVFKRHLVMLLKPPSETEGTGAGELHRAALHLARFAYVAGNCWVIDPNQTPMPSAPSGNAQPFQCSSCLICKPGCRTYLAQMGL